MSSHAQPQHDDCDDDDIDDDDGEDDDEDDDYEWGCDTIPRAAWCVPASRPRLVRGQADGARDRLPAETQCAHMTCSM